MKALIFFLALTVALALPAQVHPTAAESGRASTLVDINRASPAELRTLPAIGEVRAKQIVRMREQNGGFRCVEELRALPRLSDKQFEALKSRVTATKDGHTVHCSSSAKLER
jgi:competence protein ComEA